MYFFRVAVWLFGLVLLGGVLQAQSAQDLIAQGDKLALKDFNDAKALEVFLQADKVSPNNWEILWRISRAYVDIGEHLPANTDAQKKEVEHKYQLAYDYADQACKLAPEKSVTYLRRAIANGRIALSKGVFSVIGIVKDVKADIEKGIKLNNGGVEVQATLHYVLGRTHAKVCEKSKFIRIPLGLGWGDMDVAFAEFQKAVDMRPGFRMYRLDYAKALIEEDQYQKAKEQLYKIRSCPILDEDDNQVAAEAATLIEKIKNK
jgi:tetratricopeptide (TPR) repeat protein